MAQLLRDRGHKPHFLTVSHVLRTSSTARRVTQMELEIEKHEKEEALLFASLEKIFIEERIYKDKQLRRPKAWMSLLRMWISGWSL